MKSLAYGCTDMGCRAKSFLFLFSLLTASSYLQAHPFPNGNAWLPLTFHRVFELDEEPICHGALDSSGGFYLRSFCFRKLQQLTDNSEEAIVLAVKAVPESEQMTLELKSEDLENYHDFSNEVTYVYGLPESDIWEQLQHGQQTRTNCDISNDQPFKVYRSHTRQNSSDNLHLLGCHSDICSMNDGKTIVVLSLNFH